MATKKPTSQNIDDKPAYSFTGAQNEDGSAKEAKRSTFVPKRIKVLTLPLLKIKPNDTVFVKFSDKIFTGKQIDLGDGKAKTPPEMANVINLETGEMVQIMLGTVLCGIFHEEYPDHGYVGRGFEIKAGEQKKAKSGGNYNTYTVAEIELQSQ